jgi:hypothetical protein
VIRVAPAIVTELRANDLTRARGHQLADPLDAHGGLLQLKLAGLLALLDHRLDITLDDWTLAQAVKRRSDAVRAELVTISLAEQERVEEGTRRRHARRAVAADQAITTRRTVDVARKIARKVHAEPDRWTVAQLRRTFSATQRDIFDDALDHATAEQWITEHAGSGQGGPKRVLQRGTERP